MEHMNTRLERSSSPSDSAIDRSPQPPQPAPGDPLRLLCAVALSEKSTAPSDSPPPFLRYSLPPGANKLAPFDLTSCEPAAARPLLVEASRAWPAPGQDAGPLSAWSPMSRMSFEGVGAGFGAELMQKGAQKGSHKGSQKGANLTNPNPNLTLTLILTLSRFAEGCQPACQLAAANRPPRLVRGRTRTATRLRVVKSLLTTNPSPNPNPKPEPNPNPNPGGRWVLISKRVPRSPRIRTTRWGQPTRRLTLSL